MLDPPAPFPGRPLHLRRRAGREQWPNPHWLMEEQEPPAGQSNRRPHSSANFSALPPPTINATHRLMSSYTAKPVPSGVAPLAISRFALISTSFPIISLALSPQCPQCQSFAHHTAPLTRQQGAKMAPAVLLPAQLWDLGTGRLLTNLLMHQPEDDACFLYAASFGAGKHSRVVLAGGSGKQPGVQLMQSTGEVRGDQEIHLKAAVD